MFGPSIYALKDKTPDQKSVPVQIDYVEVPPDILVHHKNVTLCDDIFFVQGYPFFVTLSRSIKFNTVEDLSDMTISNLELACNHVLDMYTR